MRNNKTLLVLTALEHSYKKFKKVFYLGEWCLTYENKANLKIKRYKVQKHHWTSFRKLKKDSLNLEKEYERLLNKISVLLNKFHKTKFNKEYWRVIVGPWLYFYLISMFDRWESLRRLKKISTYSIPNYQADEDIFTTYDTMEYWSKATQSDSWNQANFIRILKYRFKKINFIKNIVKDKNNYLSKRINKKNNIISVLKYLITILDILFSKISFSFNKIYVETLYFSKLDAFKFQVKCKQFPSFQLKTFNYNKNEYKKINYEERKNLFKFKHQKNQNFSGYLNKSLITDFPLVFLEDYKKIDNLNYSKYKNNFKIIFSSISQIFNERYKIWLAKMIKKGTKHFIVGHGGGIPVVFLNNMFQHELKISNKYISWHKPFHKKHFRLTPPLIRKFSKKYSKNSYKEAKNCLILSCDTLRYPVKIQGFPYVEQYKSWLGDISTLINNLNKKIKDNLIYRCSATNVGFKTDKILKEKHKFLNISNFDKNSLSDELENTKISVITYPETVIPECLLSKKPMIITLSPKIYHFIPQVKNIINELKDNKIFFDSPIKASSFINSIWSDPSLWWENKNTKQAIEKLRDYTFENKINWLNDWKNFTEEQKK
jgi:putative transferase (TIGR04331 family)